MSLAGELLQFVRGLRIVDTHEHISLPEERRYERGLFALFERSYVATDFGSVGAPAEAWQMAEKDPEQAWRMLKPYIARLRNTGYYRSLLYALRELYGLEGAELTDDNWAAVHARVLERCRQSGWDAEVFRRARVAAALQDSYWAPGELPGDVPQLRPIFRINCFVTCWRRGMRDHNGNSPYDWEGRLGMEVKSFADYLELTDAAIADAKKRGAVGLKCALAYDRDLNFAPVERAVARAAFEAGDMGRPRAVEDFMMHFIADRAAAHGLPLQIHTGYLASGGVLRGRYPLALEPLLHRHRSARFTLFHGGYPFAGQVAYLARHLPHVYADWCWLPLISPSAAKAYLHEWLDQVPMSKIMWGGDCWRADTAYGALRLAQELAAQVLAEKVEAGYFSEELAREAAEWLFGRTASELFAVAAE